MADILRSFAPFPGLPHELQVKIWKCSLEASQVTPRVVQVHYKQSTGSFAYLFKVPTVLHACRLSRNIAQKFYLSLVPGAASPVYFYPQVDFLYCQVPLEASDSDQRLVSPDQPLKPFFDPETNTSLIRFLVLDNDYWVYRRLRDYTCPIKELHSFREIDEIFLALPPLTQWLERTKQIISRYQYPPGDPRADIDQLYATHRSHYACAPDAVVPGFRLCAKLTYMEKIVCCFGHRNAQPDPFHLNPDPKTCTFAFDEYWSWRELPGITEIIRAEV